MELKILYPVIDGEITGGNIVALRIIEEVLKKGGKAVVNSPSEGKFTQLLRRQKSKSGSGTVLGEPSVGSEKKQIPDKVDAIL